MIRNQLHKVSVTAFSYMFECLGFGLKLEKTDMRSLVEEMLIDMRDQGLEKGLDAIDPEAVARQLVR